MTYYRCIECNQVMDDALEAPVTLYECMNCGTIFSQNNSADGISHRCPDCNRFSAKYSENGCPVCEESELEEITEKEYNEEVGIGDGESDDGEELDDD